MASSSSSKSVLLEEDAVEAELQALQRKLGKKQQFEEAVASITAVLRDWYTAASPRLRKTIHSSISRVATILQTRYTAPGFWLVGLRLFEEAYCLVVDSTEKESLKKHIAKAREHLQNEEIEVPVVPPRDAGYLFEGHLTVDSEPSPPSWLVAQNNLLTALALQQDWTGSTESGGGPADATSDGVRSAVHGLLSGVHDVLNLENVIEASLQEIGAGPRVPPPAAKEVVANLPVIVVTEESLMKLGKETQCTVCQESLLVGDSMQELPCEHLFHPPCLRPWLDKHNSCPICRHELRTDDHAYESWKEREKEAEEDRKGAANAVRGGEFMYV